MQRGFFKLAGGILAMMLPAPGWADFQGAQHTMPYEAPPISYGTPAATDPVAQLQARLERNEVQLVRDPEFGYLPALLKELGIPASSQMLVFSRTSLHRHLISPEHPRAIFFNDDVYVGWVRWAPVLEISAADPRKGGMFYVLPQAESPNPRLKRTDSCLECHVSSKTLGVPGHLFRSFETDARGLPGDLTAGKLINHNLPMEERWGGWYVTGTHGPRSHRGNLFGLEPGPGAGEGEGEGGLEFGSHGNRLTLEGLMDPSDVLEPTSDIVALMVFGHQVHMHNFITRLNYEGIIHLQQYRHVDYLEKPIEAFLRYMLFADEPPVLSRIKGTSGFGQEFEARGPKDSRGRSLRDLDLYTRLFRHPCSYLIYSESFDQLPGPLKDRIYQRLWEVLSGQDQSAPFARLTMDQRRAILEILVETKQGLPDYFQTGPGPEDGPLTP